MVEVTFTIKVVIGELTFMTVTVIAIITAYNFPGSSQAGHLQGKSLYCPLGAGAGGGVERGPWYTL